MAGQSIQVLIDEFFSTLEKLIPEFSANPEDAFADGNVAVCVLDESGNVYGKIWGTIK